MRRALTEFFTAQLKYVYMRFCAQHMLYHKTFWGLRRQVKGFSSSFMVALLNQMTLAVPDTHPTSQSGDPHPLRMLPPAAVRILNARLRQH